jgi:ubiquinone/menaquinone biosynthesis C-methylase UbiE
MRETAPNVAPADPYVAYLHRFFGRWNGLYDLFAAPIGFVYRRALRAAVARPGRRLLELCTGTGEWAARAARAGAAVTAIDFTPSMLARARRKTAGLPVRLLEMDARRLAFADASFDVAVLSFALHDMPRAVRVEALREAARVGREGVIVLDYEPPRRRLGRALVLALLGTFETAYLRGFARDGGVAGALAASGLTGERIARPLPGLFAVYRACRPASPGGA